MSLHGPGISTLIFVAICMFSKIVKAQDFREGYVILNNNDSINGLVSYSAGNKNLARCTFKVTRRSDIVYYSPSEIQSYGFYSDKKFISLQHSDEALPEGKVFVRVLAEGPLNLYRYSNVYLIRKDVITVLPLPKNQKIETKKGQMLKEDKRYVGLLNLAMADCSLNANKTTYSEMDLTKLVLAYNECKGQKTQHKYVKPIFKMNFQIFAGYMQSNMTMNLYDDVTFNPSHTIFGGLGAEVSSPRIFDRLFFSLQGWYVNAIYQTYFEKKQSGDVHEDIIMDFTYVKVPIGFRYNFKRRNTPYIKAGFSTSFLVEESIKTLTEREILNGNVFTEVSYGGYDIKYKAYGYWMTIGYEHIIRNNLRLFSEAQYENANGFIGTPIQNFSHVNNFNFLLGIRF